MQEVWGFKQVFLFKFFAAGCRSEGRESLQQRSCDPCPAQSGLWGGCALLVLYKTGSSVIGKPCRISEYQNITLGQKIRISHLGLNIRISHL